MNSRRSQTSADDEVEGRWGRSLGMFAFQVIAILVSIQVLQAVLRALYNGIEPAANTLSASDEEALLNVSIWLGGIVALIAGCVSASRYYRAVTHRVNFEWLYDFFQPLGIGLFVFAVVWGTFFSAAYFNPLS